MPKRDPFTHILDQRRAYLRDSVWLLGGVLIAAAGVLSGSLHGGWKFFGIVPVTLVIIIFVRNWKQ